MVTGQRKYVYSSRTPIDKPWVTPELKRKYRAYRSDLRLFNNTKTHDAHQKLLESKKSYKVLSAKLKRHYKRAEGNMLDYLLKYNPKAFYSNIRKKKGPRPSVNPTIFVDHFKELVSQTIPPFESNCTGEGQTVFDELDCDITESEIFDAIKKLKREKSHGPD